MPKIRRWFGRRRQVVWSEPALPPFVKINPSAVDDPPDSIQPGDITMGMMAQEFLDGPEEEAV
ncbi:MAG TPA: hypothetical protein VH478_20640 [Trebonia sp.]|jgi:hypothetical protein|nr:hypothetical protein [Trebonia sp.]